MAESANDSPPETPAASSPVLSHKQIVTVLSGLMIGMFLAALDQTVVATATRTIADELQGLTAQAWVTTAYLITGTIATPLYGKLSDIYGRKPIYLIAIVFFTVGSVLCGMAGSIYELAAYRAVQGLGGGGLMSLAITIIADITSPRERGRYTGYFMAVFGLSSVLGPVIGGFFAGLDTFAGISGWRWIFFINIPLAIAAIAVVYRVLNLPHQRVDHRIDYLGALTLVVALVPLLTVAEQGREWGWGSTTSLTMYVIGAIGIVAFILTERRMGDEALLPPRLFRNRTFNMGNLLSGIVGIGMFGAMLTLPLYLQIVKGLTPTEAGLAIIPMVLGIMSATGVAGQVMGRTGRVKVFPVIGTALLGVALGLFSFIGVDTPLWTTMLIMVLTGGGLGLCMQTVMILVQNEVSPRDMGAATAAVTFFRQNGGTLGAAVFLSILFTVVGGRITEAFERAAGTQAFQQALRDPANAGFADLAQGGAGGVDLNDTSFLNTLDPVLARPFLEGFASAMNTVFLTGGIVMVVAFVLAVFLRDVRLSDKSALQQLADEAALAEAGAAATVAPDERVAEHAADTDEQNDPRAEKLRS